MSNDIAVCAYPWPKFFLVFHADKTDLKMLFLPWKRERNRSPTVASSSSHAAPNLGLFWFLWGLLLDWFFRVGLWMILGPLRRLLFSNVGEELWGVCAEKGCEEVLIAFAPTCTFDDDAAAEFMVDREDYCLWLATSMIILNADSQNWTTISNQSSIDSC